jgi:hypothetical protein
MAEKEKIFSSKIKHNGIFSFKDFYQFCYDWLKDETGLDITENKYEEKIEGNEKKIKIEWTGEKKVTDYFKFEVKVDPFEATSLKNVEIKKGDAIIKTNQGKVTLDVKGILVRDYDGKFERSAFSKFLRAIYEKWVIPSRIEQFEDRLVGDCSEFMAQAKAWLDLEGRKE